ncbi:MAG: hypothetical protein IJJ22_02420 [Oscillospiraceae bacterium]|nr:hypothetical protein [Oscillospiraceae bacterium]
MQPRALGAEASVLRIRDLALLEGVPQLPPSLCALHPLFELAFTRLVELQYGVELVELRPVYRRLYVLYDRDLAPVSDYLQFVYKTSPLHIF